jgi:N-acetylglucosaminyl-diphospho-decaprenol L-rhamnosyltransferase
MTPEQNAISVGVVIVTHNSERFMAKNLACLLRQTALPARLVIVDSGSASPHYLEAARLQAGQGLAAVDVVREANIGYGAGNNLGFKMLEDDCQYILFLNPDVFLGRDAIARLLRPLAAGRGNRVAAATGLLLGYDIDHDAPTGRIDSAGIFRTWYGRWYDRGQGRRRREVALGGYQYVPAICGALMLCRREALLDAALPGGDVFDPDFFLYKEDIDLSLRLRARGWRLGFDPEVESFHCRGWQARAAMPPASRLMSARNELKICRRNRDPLILFSLLKYAYVKLLER